MRQPRTPLVVEVGLANDGERTGSEAAWVGSQGKGQKIFGFLVELLEKVPGVQLQYTAGIYTVDNVPWVDAGTRLSKAQREHAGDINQGKTASDDPGGPLIDLTFRLTGEESAKHDVWCRGHFSFVGDSAWCKNGEFCGPKAPNRQLLESFVVAIVPK